MTIANLATARRGFTRNRGRHREQQQKLEMFVSLAQGLRRLSLGLLALLAMAVSPASATTAQSRKTLPGDPGTDPGSEAECRSARPRRVPAGA